MARPAETYRGLNRSGFRAAFREENARLKAAGEPTMRASLLATRRALLKGYRPETEKARFYRTHSRPRPC